jgi:sterol desaturase/sphingolipid hydroxylase (fatty acid hydroxylase superfamily)
MNSARLQIPWVNRHRDTLAWLSWPLYMSGFVALYLWGIRRGIATDTWVIAVTVINFFITLLIEQILPRDPAMNYLDDRQSWNDVGHGIMQGASKPLMQAIVIVLFAGIANWRIAHFGNLWPSELPFVVQVILAMLIGSFMDYWVHRSYHLIDRLWWFHAIHHDTPQMHIMKSARIHVGEEIINSTFKPMPLIFLGAPTEVIVFLGMWLVFDGNITHANIHQRFPAWFHYMYGTVQLHNLHHAVDRKYQDSNFSGSMPLWDIIFRTYNHPDKSPPVPVMGIRDNPVPPKFIDQVLFPFKAQLRIPPHPYNSNSKQPPTRSQ